ncbi:MAG: cupin domain-containing protein [Planctomycetes bacterium]|nr:cupin domain-containing protein [Planctomycetota bacterium]
MSDRATRGGLDTAEAWIARLDLQPLPFEGGFFRQSVCSEERSPVAREGGSRPLHTAIYYLITPRSFSTMHRLPSDEVFHFYAGDRVRMLQLSAEGAGRILHLGNDGAPGVEPQVLVPRGTWQGSELVPGGRFALLGTTMAPGFELADFEPGHAAELIAAHPQFEELLRRLCKS